MLASFLHSGDLSLWGLLVGAFQVFLGLGAFAAAVLWLIFPEMKFLSKLMRPRPATPRTEEPLDE